MKKVNLNSHIRSEIIRHVMEAWRRQQGERPRITGLPTAKEVRELDRRRRREADYRHHLALALGTFRTVPELVDEWPAMERFVPKAVVDPVGSIILPDLPA